MHRPLLTKTTSSHRTLQVTRQKQLHALIESLLPDQRQPRFVNGSCSEKRAGRRALHSESTPGAGEAPKPFASRLPALQPGINREQCLLTNGSQSKESATDDAVCWAFARASVWRPPPHWSKRDWLDEVEAMIHAAAVGASLDYESGRGVPLRAFIYLRAVAAAWNRYRQEWAYYVHSVNELASSVESIESSSDQASNEKELDQLLKAALNRLSVEDHWLIQQLFWDKADQRRVAAILQISQQCVSRRKARVLRQLRRVLNAPSQCSRISLACAGLSSTPSICSPG